MSGYYATAEVWIGNLDSPDEHADINDIVANALASNGYEVSVDVTTHAYPAKDGNR